MSTIWEKILTLESFQKKNKLPETPGVYFFLDKKKTLLYIGKATSLRDRVKSYFSRDIEVTRGPKIRLMLEKCAHVAYARTDSVLEALILETNLIKENQPPYNTDAKDDKSYNHVVITKEEFPRVLVVRGRDIKQKKFTEPVKYIFGPFLSGGALREAMKIVRRLFPYRDKCEPFYGMAKHPEPVEGSQIKKKALRLFNMAQSRPEELEGRQAQDMAVLPQPCFSAQIGLCPGVCVGKVSAKEYGRTINHIRLFFEGHKGKLVQTLKREMKTAVKNLEFERAQEMKKTLFGIEHINDMALIKDDKRERNAHRIEAYDVAHLQGESSVGVMTVVEDSLANSDEYRQFTLRRGHNGNDLAALREILTRRLKHSEWPLPEIIVVDGSLLQSNVAEEVLAEANLFIPIVGVVKNKKHQPERLTGSEQLVKRFEKEILLANNEAHRFALRFHRKRRGKEFLGG